MWKQLWLPARGSERWRESELSRKLLTRGYAFILKFYILLYNLFSCLSGIPLFSWLVPTAPFTTAAKYHLAPIRVMSLRKTLCPSPGTAGVSFCLPSCQPTFCFAEKCYVTMPERWLPFPKHLQFVLRMSPSPKSYKNSFLLNCCKAFSLETPVSVSL